MPNYTLKEWADRYRKFGWNVLPLTNNSKGSVPGGWKQWQDKKPNDQEFDELFKATNITGLAVVTGKVSGITVIDEDSHYKDGETFKGNSPLVSLTGRKGKHYFFKYKEGIRDSLNAQKHIDIKSFGLVVLPPSKVFYPETKTYGIYEWLKTSIKNLNDLPTLDDNFIENTKVNNNETKSLTELLSVNAGERWISARSLIFKILNRFKPEEWRRLAIPFIQAELAKYNPPFVGLEADKLIRDAMIKISGNPPEVYFKNKEETIPAPVSLIAAARERIEERKLEKLAPKTGFKELDECIYGFLPGHVYVLAAETNIGKTALACNFAYRVAQQGKKTLYFALETQNWLVDYIASIGSNKRFDELTDKDIFIENPNIQIYRDEVQSLENLLITIEKEKNNFSLMVIDNIGYFIKDKQNTTQDQFNTMKKIASIAKSAKIAILVIVHTNKPTSIKSALTMDRISGSAAFKQDATEVFLISREKINDDPEEVEFSDRGLLRIAKAKGMTKSIRLWFTKRSATIKTDYDLRQETRLLQDPANLIGQPEDKLEILSERLTELGFPDRIVN